MIGCRTHRLPDQPLSLYLCAFWAETVLWRWRNLKRKTRFQPKALLFVLCSQGGTVDSRGTPSDNRRCFFQRKLHRTLNLWHKRHTKLYKNTRVAQAVEMISPRSDTTSLVSSKNNIDSEWRTRDSILRKGMEFSESLLADLEVPNFQGPRHLTPVLQKGFSCHHRPGEKKHTY